MKLDKDNCLICCPFAESDVKGDKIKTFCTAANMRINVKSLILCPCHGIPVNSDFVCKKCGGSLKLKWTDSRYIYFCDDCKRTVETLVFKRELIR